MLGVISELTVIEYVFRSHRWSVGGHPLIFMIPNILTFQSPRIGVEIRNVLTKSLVWGNRGGSMLVFSFL